MNRTSFKLNISLLIQHLLNNPLIRIIMELIKKDLLIKKEKVNLLMCE